MKKIIKNLISIFVLVTFSFGPNFAFATPLFTIDSATADNITQTGTTLNGTVSSNGTTINVWYQDQNGSTLSGSEISGINGNNITLPPFLLTGLTADTSYTYKLVATDGPEISMSNISFTTVANPVPSVDSATADNITQTGTTLNGTVSSNGTTINVWYQDQNGSTLSGSEISGINGNNITLPPFLLTGLTADTSYTYKLVATDGPEIVFSNILFTTLPTSGNGGSNPTLDSISPTSGTQGQTLDITLTGTNFVSDATSDFGSDITINSTTFNNATSLTTNITISGSATTGVRNVTVTSGGQTTGSQTFTINSSGGSSGGGGNGGGSGGGNSGSSSSYSPAVITQNAINITINSSTLNGSINPNGYATTGWFEYGTSATSLGVSNGLETDHISLGLESVATVLSQNLTNLSPNTTYYFRAVANNSYGTIKGNILSFKTAETTVIPVTTPMPSVSITTVQAINKTTISAKLNGIFVNQTGTQAQVYFKYGKTASLGKTTAIKNLESISSTSFSQIITNLDPDTIYFFKAVAVNQGSTYNGNILVFKTSKEIIINPKPVITNVEDSTIIAKSVESSIVEDKIDYLNTTTTEFEITNSTENVSIGDEINYVVNFKNITSKDLENVKITVQLPKEVDFVESNLGTKGDDNTVVFKTKNLVPNQIGSITIKGTVNLNASLNKILVTTATMSYNIAGLTFVKDEIAYATNYVIEKSTGLEANPLFGLISLPYILGYFALLLIIIAFIIIGRKIYIKNKLNKSTKIITDHINNLEK